MNRYPVPPGPGSADDPDYSATELASHWIQRPEPAPDAPPVQDAPPVHDTRPTVHDTRPPVHDTRPTVHDTRPLPGATPVDDTRPLTVLRFGPGVPPAPPPPVPILPTPGPGARRPSPARRFALPALVFLCVLAFLAWQRYGPTVAVREVTVHTDGVELTGTSGDACGGTAAVVGLVRTDGRPGTLTYRWLRSDGSASPVLTERVRGGQKEARLQLLWTFSGEGAYTARADLEVLTPSRHGAGTSFAYRCG
ncbi:hypothetical protein [Streptomyces sp. TRM64462]|uniref:hypothetical protein n=1 Tax=Streptomyces sp. TRM64462 TaxID=2741726 RepID=UPI001586DDFE|nr:hypothetical protein [Streptomyces sp. TRM64462]